MEQRALVQGSSRDQCTWDPSSGTTLTQFYSSSTNIYLLDVLCTQYIGVAHHRALQTSRRGWADSKAVHGMECSGVCSLYWRSLTAGAATWSVPYRLYTRVCSPKQPNTKEPQVLCPGGIYSWWHLASPANGSRSHDCAPVAWAYGIPCPAMVSPNAGADKEDKVLHPDDYHI